MAERHGRSMSRVLVIEDEEDIRSVLDYNLRQAGHEVLLAGRGYEGIDLARSGSPDIVLLDLMLPDLPGTEVCRTLRQAGNVPIVMVTARSEELDRVVGLELGADDYVIKPFSVRELILRVNAILRRHSDRKDGAETSEFGLLRVDRGSHRVWIGGLEIELTALELRLLLALYDRRDRVQSRATLLRDVWEMRAGVTTRTVDTHVKRLREKLGVARDYVETVRGSGYRFAAAPPPPA